MVNSPPNLAVPFDLNCQLLLDGCGWGEFALVKDIPDVQTYVLLRGLEQLGRRLLGETVSPSRRAAPSSVWNWLQREVSTNSSSGDGKRIRAGITIRILRSGPMSPWLDVGVAAEQLG